MNRSCEETFTFMYQDLKVALPTNGQTNGRMDGQTDGRTDRRMNVQKISPYYRTSSPIGGTALPPPMKSKEKVEQGKGSADHLMHLDYLRKGGASHCPNVHPYVHLSVQLYVHTSCTSINPHFCPYVHSPVHPSNSEPMRADFFAFFASF